MIISQAHREFQIRRYLWSKLRAAEEIRDEFPHFWLFKGGRSWKYYQFLRTLKQNERELFVCATLKRFHHYAALDLGETTSVEEGAIEEQYFQFQERSPFERELISRRQMGEPITLASKRKVQKAMFASFQKAFGTHELETVHMRGYPVPFLRMKFSGWIVQTNFVFGGGRFGGGRSVIDYNHLIASEERICHPTTQGVTAPALVLDYLICWIGMGPMEWDFLTDEDVEPACDSVVTLCREFFDELPKLLRGLEREEVSACEAS